MFTRIRIKFLLREEILHFNDTSGHYSYEASLVTR